MAAAFICFLKKMGVNQIGTSIRIAALTLACTVIQPASAMPANTQVNDDLLERISRSFSKIPFGAQLKEVEMPLSEIRHSNCAGSGPCWTENADRVRHIFNGQEQRLTEKYIKHIVSYRRDDKPINALDIGFAHKKEDVVQRITSFLGGIKYECVKVSDWTGYLATVYAEESLCTWKVQDAEVSARFLDYRTGGNSNAEIVLDELAFRRNAK
jgi:hypothetical protein